MNFDKNSSYHQILLKTYGEVKGRKIIKNIGTNSLGFEIIRRSSNFKGGFKSLNKKR